MAEKMKDAEDRKLDAMFAAEPLMDDGFSEQVVRKIRRRLWLRRMILPIAATLGSVVAYKPVAAFVSSMDQLATLIPIDVLAMTDVAVPQFPIVLLGAALFAVVMLGSQAIER